MSEPFELNDKYNTVLMLDEYNGIVSIVMGEYGNDGNLYKKWVFPELRKGGQNVPAAKAIPFGVRLGDRNQAVSALYHFLELLGATPNGESRGKDDDIPF